jgi:hypothetical protein
MLPKNRPHPSQLEVKLRSAKQAEANVISTTDAALAQEIERLRAQAELAAMRAEQAQRQKESLRKQQAVARQQEVEIANERRAAALAQRWPNWKGPWRTCGVCEGTGRDAAEERAINTRNAGIIASRNVGPGSVTKIPGAVVPCELCGGTGVVPRVE